MGIKDENIEQIKKNLDFGVYGNLKLNNSGAYLLMGQKKMLVFEKGKSNFIILYNELEYLEIIEVFSGGGIDFGLIPTRPNSIVLGNELKIKLKTKEIIIPFDIDSLESIKLNEENLEKIKELHTRFFPDVKLEYNYDPYFL